MTIKAPPPPLAMRSLSKDSDTFEVNPAVRLFLDGVLLELNKETDYVLMTARGARLLAGRLQQVAHQLERQGSRQKPIHKERREWYEAKTQLRRVQRYLNQKA